MSESYVPGSAMLLDLPYLLRSNYRTMSEPSSPSMATLAADDLPEVLPPCDVIIFVPPLPPLILPSEAVADEISFPVADAVSADSLVSQAEIFSHNMASFDSSASFVPVDVKIV